MIFYLLVIDLLIQALFVSARSSCIKMSSAYHKNLCNNIGYNSTKFPNYYGDKNLMTAASNFESKIPLVDMECASRLNHFVCNIYFPYCDTAIDHKPLWPCRELCEEVRDSCRKRVGKDILKWPFKCEDLPSTANKGFCYGPESNDRFSCKHEAEFTCPGPMQTPNLYKNHYVFMGEENCGAPCEEDKLLFWTKNERKTAAVWIGSLSFLCAISTLFTVLTYFIDMKRFHYPERPIVFLSGCYLGVSIAYICGYFLADSVACQSFRSDVICPNGPIEACPKVVTQGAREAGCTILFMLVYFFSQAGSIWWIVLSFTWFLAAGLKWGHEAIEEKSSYFHGVAWAVPAIQTIVVLITSKIEGDVLSGVCFVGVYNTDDLLSFLLVPLSIYLGIGTVFLFAGFYAMYNIRNQVRRNDGGGSSKVHKLERLMVKIGVFSVLYTVPATVMIACYFYEYFNRNSWQRGWLYNNCQSYSIPCPCQYATDVNHKPSFVVFVIKYSMMLIVGITSGFWIWSAKTVESWTSLADRVLCSSSRQRGSGAGGQTRYQRAALPSNNNNNSHHTVTTALNYPHNNHHQQQQHHHHHHHQLSQPLYMQSPPM